jgi:hypothetical protein
MEPAGDCVGRDDRTLGDSSIHRGSEVCSPQPRQIVNDSAGMINEVSLGETLYLYENQLKGSLAEFGNDALGGPDFSPVGSWFSPGDAGAFGGNFNSALPISIPNPFGGPGGANFPGAPPWCDAWCRF